MEKLQQDRAAGKSEEIQRLEMEAAAASTALTEHQQTCAKLEAQLEQQKQVSVHLFFVCVCVVVVVVGITRFSSSSSTSNKSLCCKVYSNLNFCSPVSNYRQALDAERIAQREEVARMEEQVKQLVR